jgi:Fe2+ or Zn2+ uptake regulation protein
MTDLIQKSTHLLRARGGRMTPQRRMILEALEQLDSHPTAEELFNIVRQRNPDLHLSTVYRTLRWLEQEALISTCWFEDEPRQERFDPSHADEHHHFRCTACNRVTEFDSPMLKILQTQFEKKFGGRVDSISLTLYGLCPDCNHEQRGDEREA